MYAFIFTSLAYACALLLLTP